MKQPTRTDEKSLRTEDKSPRTDDKSDALKGSPASNAAEQKDTAQAPSDEERRRRVSEAAYYRAERRSFAPGQEDEDWLEAEKELDGSEQGASKKPEANDFPSPK